MTARLVAYRERKALIRRRRTTGPNKVMQDIEAKKIGYERLERRRLRSCTTVAVAFRTDCSSRSPLVMILRKAACAPFLSACSNNNGLESRVRTMTAISG